MTHAVSRLGHPQKKDENLQDKPASVAPLRMTVSSALNRRLPKCRRMGEVELEDCSAGKGWITPGISFQEPTDGSSGHRYGPSQG